MKKSPRIGILGGGQLARMLASEGAAHGLEIHILSENKTDPAAQISSHWQKGSPVSAPAIRKFAKSVDLLTFESEFIDARLFKNFSKGKFIFPSIEAIHLLQDRKTQKELFDNFDLPTAFWISFSKNVTSKKISPKTMGKILWSVFPRGFVLKQRRNGYDGYGTFIFRTKKDWLTKAPQNLENFIAEELVQFKRELAIVVGRTKKNKFFHFPLVETHQTNAQCDWVKGPVTHRSEKKLLKQLQKFLDAINYVGVMGVELFQTNNGQLVLNEIAPRVHNSAHYSLTACNVSQFTAHLLAGLGQDIPAIKLTAPHFAMVNLLGQSSKKPVLPSKVKGTLYWYGKLENRPRRKMGHINLVGKSPKVLKDLINDRRKFRL